MLTVKEASSQFGIPKATIYEYIRKGKLKAVRHPLSQRVLIPEEELPKLQAASVFYPAKEEGNGN
jgi:excisionase family DNA binding protein